MEPWIQRSIKGLIGPGERPFAVSLHLPSTTMQARRCACALVLVCLLALLLPPEGALGEVQARQELPEPRAANWFANFNKYVGKIFSDSLEKFKNQKKPTDATKLPPPNSTKFLAPNSTKPLPKIALVLEPPITSPGPR